MAEAKPKKPLAKKVAPKKTATKPVVKKDADPDAITVTVNKPSASMPVKKSAPKPLDAAELISVTVNKSPVKPVERPIPTVPATKPAKPSLVEDEDIPDDLLPSSDELNLNSDSDPSTMSAKQMDEWFEGLDTLEAPKISSKESLAETPKTSQAERDYKAMQAKEGPQDEEKIDLKAPIESLVTPDPEADKADKTQNEVPLRGFIVGQDHKTRAPKPVHQEAQDAREVMQSPKVFDTKLVHKAIVPAKKRGQTSVWSNWPVFLLIILLIAGVYIAIDIGLLGEGVKVPWHIVS